MVPPSAATTFGRNLVAGEAGTRFPDCDLCGSIRFGHWRDAPTTSTLCLVYHLTTRSIAEERIFRDGGDYATGLSTIAGVVQEGLVTCHMVCLMPTHYHLLATVDHEDVSRVLHKINRRYAVRFNRRHARRGKVFDPPPTAVHIESEEHFLEAVRYIANNPSDPDAWPYSTYPSLIGLAEPFAFVDPAPIFDAFPDPARLRAFVEERREDANVVPPSAATTFG